jgi:hypothetical protein
MKAPVLVTLFFWALPFSQAQTQPSTTQYDIELQADVLAKQKVKAGRVYQRSFPTKRGQYGSLKIKLRNRISASSVLKASVPLLAATMHGLLKQQGVTPSVEGQRPASLIVPYLAGGALASGASYTLMPKRKKAYVELTYRSQAGTTLDRQRRWMNIGKATSISIKGLPDGWVDVSIAASPNQGLVVQEMNFVTSDRPIGGGSGTDPVTNSSGCDDPDGPRCDPDEGDSKFGITGGSGSDNNPYQLSEIIVLASGTGSTTDYGSFVYYYSGGSYGNTYYSSGYYQYDGTSSVGSSGSNGPGTNDPVYYDHAFHIVNMNNNGCFNYDMLHNGSQRDGKEYGALLTADGNLITLPNAANTLTNVTWSNLYYDGLGRIIVNVYQENGKWMVQLNDYSTHQSFSYEVSGMVHTHPVLPGYDTYNPSPDDINVMNNYPGLRQFIVTGTEDFEFNQSGKIPNSTLPYCGQ